MNANDIITIILLSPMLAVCVGLFIDLHSDSKDDTLFRDVDSQGANELRYVYTPLAYTSTCTVTDIAGSGFTSKESPALYFTSTIDK